MPRRYERDEEEGGRQNERADVMGSEVSMRHVVRKCVIPSPWRCMASAHAHWHLSAVCTGRIIGDPEPVCKRRASSSPGWNRLAFLEAKITRLQVGGIAVASEPTTFNHVTSSAYVLCLLRPSFVSSPTTLQVSSLFASSTLSTLWTAYFH
jgi:hypothetical protein